MDHVGFVWKLRDLTQNDPYADVVCCSCVAAAKVPNNTQDMVRLLKSLFTLL